MKIQTSITEIRALELYNLVTNENLTKINRKKLPLEIPANCLNEKELSNIDITQGKCLLQKEDSYYRTSYELWNLESRTDFYFDGATNEQKIIFSTIKEAFEKSKRLFKNIEAVVDILQEINHKEADNFVALYEILKALETIQKYRQNLKNLPKKWAGKGRQFYDYLKGAIVLKEYTDNETNISVDSLKFVPISQLLGVLVDLLELPKNTSVKGGR